MLGRMVMLEDEIDDVVAGLPGMFVPRDRRPIIAGATAALYPLRTSEFRYVPARQPRGEIGGGINFTTLAIVGVVAYLLLKGK